MLHRRIFILRERLAGRLIDFLLSKRINNPVLMRGFLFLYYFLVHGNYVRDHVVANHHYIPRFLLRNFAIRGTGNIYEYERNAVPNAVSIGKQAALEKNLYSFTDKKTRLKSDYAEKVVFAKGIEKYGARVIARILETRSLDLTHLEASILSSFIAFQYTRTPRFLDLIRILLTYFIKGRGISIDEITKRDFFLKAFIRNDFSIRPEEVFEFMKKAQLGISGVDDLVLRLSTQIANEIQSKIHLKDWSLVFAEKDDFFFLTDGAVEMINLKNNRSVGPFLWQVMTDAVVILPISPEICVCYSDRNITRVVNFELIEKVLLSNIYKKAYSDRVSEKISQRLRQ